MTSRPLSNADLPMLQRALDQDEFVHLSVKNYTMDSAYSVVYEDDAGPIGVLRYTKEGDRLRLVTVWCDNHDRVRNGASVTQAISDTVTLAKANGFKAIVFATQSLTLAGFCQKHLGFEKDKDEYVRYV